MLKTYLLVILVQCDNNHTITTVRISSIITILGHFRMLAWLRPTSAVVRAGTVLAVPDNLFAQFKLSD